MVRTDDSPQEYTEPFFTFLNRSADAEISQIRDRLEEWFQRYPEEERAELQSRMLAGNDSFNAALLELYLHRALTIAGCTVAVHPQIEAAEGKRPDFLVIEPSGSKFLLEARVATGISDEERGAEARMDDFLERVSRLNSDYMLDVRTSGAQPHGFGIRAFMAWIKGELGKLDYSSIRASHAEKDSKPVELKYPNDEWEVRINVYAKSEENRGTSGSLISYSTGARCIDPYGHVRDAVQRKASRYGQLPLPYLIAVLDLGTGDDVRDATQALFGKLMISWRVDGTTDREPEIFREPDGAWQTPFGPKATRVSGVLILKHLTVWDPTRTISRLYLNPWATKPYSGLLEQMPRCVVDASAGELTYPGGRSIGAWLMDQH